jgi:hypothetical protein
MTTLSKQDYLDLVRTYAKPQADLDDLLAIVLGRLPSDESEERLRAAMEAFLFDPASGRAGIVDIVTLSGGAQALRRPGFHVHNWYYDRVSGAILINLRAGVHESLSAALYKVYRGGQALSQEDASEKFITEGLGWFRSASSCGRALKGPEVKLNAQEKVVFGPEFMPY